MSLVDVVGWIGTALILGAFALVTRRGVSRTYQALNLTGAACLIVNVSAHHDAPAVALNLAWAAIAVYGFARLSLKPSP